MAASIREVAKLAGVSPGTVSHVLNGNATARIATATQERVRQAAASLGYRPNHLARSLGRRRTDTIGLLISGLQNAFFVALLENAQLAARRVGFNVLVDVAPSEHGTYKEHGVVSTTWPVDGVLVWSVGEQRARDFLGSQADSIPIVYLGNRPSEQFDVVTFDYQQGGSLAARHLIERGYRRIGYVSPYPFGVNRRDDPRNVGFARELASVGLESRWFLTNAEQTRAAGLAAAEQVAELPTFERPDALFCHNDMLATGVYCGVRRAGLRVPEDIAVIGFDGTEETLFLEKPLTTVVTDTAALCENAIQRLCARIATNSQIESTTHIALPTQLRVGSST